MSNLIAPGPERRLSTILVADAVGYSRWMSSDEEGTLRALTLARSIIVAVIGSFQGRVFSGAGDSILAEFASPVDAVRCAVDIQKRLAERPDEAWAGPPLSFRVGVHVGDVMVAGDDLLGDAVNVAARIEASADSGGVCVSAAVLDHVEGRLPLLYEPIGEQQFKNLDRPIRLYRVMARADQVGARPSEGSARASSIAVLPFTVMGPSEDIAYLGDGLAEDIVAKLTRFRELRVIAWSSSLAYKGRAAAIEQIGLDLKVRYVLTGSVRRGAAAARVTARLVNTADGTQVWAERYDRSLGDLFDIQEDLARRIVVTLVAHVNDEEVRRVRGGGTADLEAFSLLAQANEALYRFEPEGNRLARSLLERARERDPRFARVVAALSVCHHLDWTYGWGDDPAGALARAEALAQEAVELDPMNARAHAALGYAHITANRPARAMASYERALALNPNDADILAEFGLAQTYAGWPAKAVATLSQAIDLNPLAPDWYHWFLGNALFSLGRYGDVIAVIGRMRDRTQGARLLAACHALEGHAEQARSHAREVLAAQPDFTVSAWIERLPRDPDDRSAQSYAEGLRKAGLPP